MFIGRRNDNSIYGLWTVRQWPGQEEKPDNDAEVLAFMSKPLPKQTIAGAALADVLIAKGVITQADVDAAVSGTK